MLPTTYQETLQRQYLYTTRTFLANLEGISDEEAFIQPQGGGHCMNWVAGHIVQHRALTLQLLGCPFHFPFNKYTRYNRGTDPILKDGPKVVPLSEMREDWSATGKDLLANLESVKVETLAKPAPYSPLGDDEETVGSLVAGLLFHESYHIGQVGLLRRLLGKDGAIA